MKTKLMAFLAVFIVTVGCASEETELFDALDQHLTDRMSRCYEEVDTVTTDTVVPMVMTEEILSLNEVLNSLRQIMPMSGDEEEPEEDPYIDNNIYAIRDIPVSMNVPVSGPNSKSERRWIRTRGTGKELMLDYKYLKVNWGFRIKPMPITTGIHNLIYSDDLKVPLTIGKLKDGTAVLMAQENDNQLTDFVSWDIIPSKKNPGYFQIRSSRYVGQLNPSDPFSIFNYTIEASKNNNIRFARPVEGKKQQEFLILPMDTTIKFRFDSVNYNFASAKITGPYYYDKERSIDNYTYENKDMDVIFDFNVKEKSKYQTRYGKIFPNFIESGKLKRPVLVGQNLVEPRGDTPKDVDYRDSIETTIETRIFYKSPVFVNKRSTYYMTLRFQYSYVTLDYEVKAYYTDKNGLQREMMMSGGWTGKIYQNPKLFPPIIVKTEEKSMDGDDGNTDL